jgi:hypothetical protein
MSWLLVDHHRDDAVVAGPFKTMDEAARSRRSLERSGLFDDANLWIAPEETDHG